MYVYLLVLTFEAGIPRVIMRELICGKNIVYVFRYDGMLMDIVNEGISYLNSYINTGE